MYRVWELNCKNTPLTPSTKREGLWPKQLINQGDYHTVTQCKVHNTHDTQTPLIVCNIAEDKATHYAFKTISSRRAKLFGRAHKTNRKQKIPWVVM